MINNVMLTDQTASLRSHAGINFFSKMFASYNIADLKLRPLAGLIRPIADKGWIILEIAFKAKLAG